VHVPKLEEQMQSPSTKHGPELDAISGAAAEKLDAISAATTVTVLSAIEAR